MIVLKELRQEHVNYMKEDSCEDLAKNLAHVYHFYLHGIQGSAKKLNFDRIGSVSQFQVHDLKVFKIV